MQVDETQQASVTAYLVWSVSPVILHIVDIEFEIGRDHVRLDRREIGSNDFSVWMLVCEVNRPYASPSTELEEEISLALYVPIDAYPKSKQRFISLSIGAR